MSFREENGENKLYKNKIETSWSKSENEREMEREKEREGERERGGGGGGVCRVIVKRELV